MSAAAVPIDLPPLQMELLRLGLRGEPAREICSPQVPGTAPGLLASLSGSSPCRREASRIRIDQPPGWPPLPPPPPPAAAAPASPP